MKTSVKSIIAATAMAVNSAWATPSPNTYHGVTNDWYNANFSNVLERADLRLAANSNDIVGVTLKVAYHMTYGDLNSYSNSVARFIQVADTVTAPSFSNLYWAVRSEEIRYRDEYLPTRTQQLFEQGLPKAQLPHMQIPEDIYLKLLWDDGQW